MRNWNFQIQVKKQVASSASRLPMRNWNPADERELYLKGLASRLPMRNWNPKIIPVAFRVEYCFQTTYEELKQVHYVLVQLLTFKLPDYLWGIETVLDWWKRKVAGPLPDYLWGIETWSSIRNICICRWASRLPMRNWNILKPRRICSRQ